MGAGAGGIRRGGALAPWAPLRNPPAVARRVERARREGGASPHYLAWQIRISERAAKFEANLPKNSQIEAIRRENYSGVTVTAETIRKAEFGNLNQFAFANPNSCSQIRTFGNLNAAHAPIRAQLKPARPGTPTAKTPPTERRRTRRTRAEAGRPSMRATGRGRQERAAGAERAAGMGAPASVRGSGRGRRSGFRVGIIFWCFS